VVQNEENHRADNRDDDAPEVKPGDSRLAKPIEEPTPRHRSNDPEYNVHHDTLTRLVHDLTRYEAGDQTEHDPSQDRHISTDLSST